MVTAVRNDLVEQYITLFGTVASTKPGLLDLINSYLRSLPHDSSPSRREIELAKIGILERECGWSFMIQELKTLAVTLFL